ncbi:MAG: YpdA family putative bacillithiol disulfide reductase [Sphingobacteriales bacterium]|nr:MAG: YpdA family putative bacillithiol disulfide reductase [Sphingobacteriales bacterium]
MEQFTLAIIGGGPIGIACALEAQRQGIDHVVLEKGTLVNSIYHYPVNMTFFSTSERLEIGGVPFVTNQPKPKRADALEYYRRVAQDRKVNLRLFEEVIDVQDADHGFLLVTSKGQYAARFVILATGFYDIPYTLNVPGEDLPKVKHYYDDPHYYAFQKVVVVGAQNSAVDAALETWRKGAEVTMVIRAAEIGQRVKYWVRPDIVNRIEEGSIKAYFQSTIERITPDSVEIRTPDGLVRIDNDWVLALTGYQPNLPFLRKLGIQLSDDEVCQPGIHPDTHETNREGIYLAGVICGGMNTHRLFIENSREHAGKIMAHIQSRL